MMDWQNKTVVITGASSGIGEASALEFAKRGAATVLVARRKDRLSRVEKRLSETGANILAISCDVSDKKDVGRMHESVMGRFGSVDVLVNNAGFAIYDMVRDQSVEEIESQMATNYLGMVYCTKSFLPSMLERNLGHIVNVASVAASLGLAGMAPYCASKFAMLGFSEGLKYELHNTNVGVTVVSPITVKTSLFDHPSFGGSFSHTSMSLDSKTVAKAVLKAASSSKLEIMVPSAARGVVWARHTFPYLINPILGSIFRKRLDSVHR